MPPVHPRYVPSSTALEDAQWQRSSHSTQMNNCVETALVPPGRLLAVRDSKNPGGPALLFGPAAWTGLVSVLRSG